MSDISSIAGLPPTWEEQQAPVLDAPPEELGQQTFLNLLTTQLQNQDPMDPIKNEDFIAQLAQFSSLEQLMSIQGSLDAVYTGIAAMNNATMATLLGKDVVALGNAVSYPGEGEVDLHFEAAESFEGGTITIKDESGTVVYSGALDPGTAGENTFTWDGNDLYGQPVPDGVYTFDVSATGSEGGQVAVDELIVGTVTEMDYSSGMPMPSIEGVPIDLGAILRLTTGEGA